MPRHARLNISGGIYHVITRGLERRKIFKDNQDREEFLFRLEAALEQTGSECHAWVLMDNHIHLLIRTGEQALSDLMRKVLTGYAVYFNHRYRRHGYLYQNRYKSILCQEDVYYLELVRYIHLNPVRAGYIKTIGQLNKYPWTGHSAIMGKQPKAWPQVDEVLKHFAKYKGTAVKKYQAFIEEGFTQGKRPELVGGGLKRSAGGWEGIKALKVAKQSWRGDERILGDGDFVSQTLKQHDEKLTERDALKKAGWDLQKLSDHVCEMFSIEQDELYKKGRANARSKAKHLMVFWAHNKLGISGKEIADYLRVSRPTVSYSIEKGEEYAKEYNVNLLFVP